MTEISLPYGFTPRGYQQPVWDAMVHYDWKRAITVWPRRNGKDLVALNILTALSMKRVGLYFYIAPYYTQVRSIIWNGSDGDGRRFIDYIPPELIKKKNEAELKLELVNGSMIRLCGSDNIDSIVGNNPVGIVFTEFSLHKPDAWHYLRPVLAENGGWALFNGTPRGLNHFYQLYEAAKRDSKWFTQYLTRDDTAIPTLPAIADDRSSGMPESLIQQEYFCSWTSSSEETLIPLDLLEPAINREVNEDYIDSQSRIIGVDVAFAEKGDKAVIARRQGTLLHTLDKYQGMDNMALASKVATYIDSWRPSAVFVDAGRGEGVISRLYQLGHDNVVFPVHFGGKTYSDLYNRKKDEMWCKTKMWFSHPDHFPSIPDDEELIRDLSAPTFGPDDRGFIKVESKAQLRRRGYSSTDCADALILTFAEDVSLPMPYTEDMRRQGITPQMLESLYANRADSGTQQADYNPLNYMESLSGNQQSQQSQEAYDPLTYMNNLMAGRGGIG